MAEVRVSEQQQRFASAVELLKGTSANYGLCWASMLTCLGIGVVGLVMISDEPEAGYLSNRRVMASQSLLFLLVQGFTVAKVFRDKAMFEATAAFAFANPTREYMVQVVLGLAAALAFSIYSLLKISYLAELRGVFAMLILWVTCNALCLSKAVRDRHDAREWSKYPVEQQGAHLQDLLKIARGTIEYRVVVAVSAVAAVVTMLGLMWSWSSEVLVIERKGFITACVLWCEVSSFHTAKLVRDRMDPLKAKELSEQKAYQLLIFGSSLLSMGLLTGGIIAMPLEANKKLFLITGAMFILSTAFFLAKNVRDRLEARKLSSPSPTSHLPGGHAVLGSGREMTATSPMVIMRDAPATTEPAGTLEKV
eukprot:gnl/TRDRNA2_/TRDRNA2_176372_c0_seq2.p1 gnl/TRDRNA2_/TRDRNA2_176372_c0~~gnl/TRDRNA2_/TRDRNA2_176372_c0_seq2.p1  ORF type:complete len:365 (-),score=55.71 gnl/TRDRNA2_/TRDRNA2_176372_c0_seq2:148-1242(-)